MNPRDHDSDAPEEFDFAAFSQGRQEARDELFRRLNKRLERLAHKMLQRFPRVRRWDDTVDVLQNSVIRLLRALEAVRPATEREFFGLAAEQMRRELLDLARRYYGPEGIGTNHITVDPNIHGVLLDSADRNSDDPDELERWTALHEAVADLPHDVRETFGLIFYQGCTQVQAARICEADERTIRRRWNRATATLQRRLGKLMPTNPGDSSP